jgi:hypothetical protein
MSLYRVVLAGLAAVFTVGMTSLASAGCYGCAMPAPIQYAPSYCGGCGVPTAAIVYAQPVMPAPPVAYGFAGGCGCGHQSVVYAAPPIAPTPIAPAPIYVVNQGPEYDGPGITVPYHTWAPVSAYGPVAEYPDDEGYGMGYGMGYGRGYGYRHHFYGHRYGPGYGYGPGLGLRYGYGPSLGLRYGYGPSLGLRYGYGPRPWRFGAHLAYHRHFGGYPMRHWPMPMLRRHWYR